MMIRYFSNVIKKKVMAHTTFLTDTQQYIRNHTPPPGKIVTCGFTSSV